MRTLWGMTAVALLLMGFFAKNAGFWILGAIFAAILCAGAHFMSEKREVAMFLVGVLLFLCGAVGGVLGALGGHNTGDNPLTVVLMGGAAFIAFICTAVTVKLLRKGRDEAV